MPGEEQLTSTKVKIIILGDAGVGKSCLAAALVQGAAFTAAQLAQIQSTPGFEYHSVYLTKTIQYQLFDLSGRDVYSELRSDRYQDATIVLLAFDLTQPHSFEHLNDWLGKIPGHTNHPDYRIILVGTKSDLVDQRQVSEKAIITFREQQQAERQQEIPYIAVSVLEPQVLQASLSAAIQRFHPMLGAASSSHTPTLNGASSTSDAPVFPLLLRRGSRGNLNSCIPSTLFGPTSLLTNFHPNPSLSSSSSSSSSNTASMTGSSTRSDGQPAFFSDSVPSDSPPSSSRTASGGNGRLSRSSISLSGESSGLRDEDDSFDEKVCQASDPSLLSTAIENPDPKFSRSFRKIYTLLFENSFFKDWFTPTVQEVIKDRYRLFSFKSMQDRAQEKPESRTAKTMTILKQLETIRSKADGYKTFCEDFRSQYAGFCTGQFMMNSYTKMKRLLDTLNRSEDCEFKTLTIDILCHAQLDPSSRTAKAVSVVLSRILPVTVGDPQQEVMFQSPYSLDRTF